MTTSMFPIHIHILNYTLYTAHQRCLKKIHREVPWYDKFYNVLFLFKNTNQTAKIFLRMHPTEPVFTIQLSINIRALVILDIMASNTTLNFVLLCQLSSKLCAVALYKKQSMHVLCHHVACCIVISYISGKILLYSYIIHFRENIAALKSPT